MRAGRRSSSAPGTHSVPRWIFVPAGLGTVFVVLPLVALATRVDWARFGALITTEESLDALEVIADDGDVDALPTCTAS